MSKEKSKKEKKPKPVFAKICPKCGSLNIAVYNYTHTAIGLPTLYKCKNCGNVSHFFPEVDINEKRKNKKNVKSKASV